MTDVFEYSTYSRKELKYQFSDLTPEQGELKKNMLADFNAEQEKKKALAAQEAAKKAAESKPAEGESKKESDNTKES